MLRTRLATSAPLIAVALGAVFWRGFPGAVLFLLLATGFVILAISEFFSMAEGMGLPGFPRMTTLLSLILVVAVWQAGVLGGHDTGLAGKLEASVLAGFVSICFLLVFRSRPSARELTRHFVSLGGFLCITWMLCFLVKLYFVAGLHSSGRHLVFFALLVTKIGDAGAFAAGALTAQRPGGNHKLAPRLSPKKSWEGLAGGIVASTVSALILVACMGGMLTVNGTVVLSWLGAVLFGFLFSALGLLGDLAESAMKRAAGVKDSGNIPGLGGALDILDSLVIVAPAFYLYVTLWALR